MISAQTVAGMLAKVSFLNTLTCNFVNKLVHGSVSGRVYNEFCFSRSQSRVSIIHGVHLEVCGSTMVIGVST